MRHSNLITKCDRLLLQSASGITKCDRLYYKVCQVLQSVTVITGGVTIVGPSNLKILLNLNLNLIRSKFIKKGIR